MNLGRSLLVRDVEWVLSVGMGKCFKSNAGALIAKLERQKRDKPKKKQPMEHQIRMRAEGVSCKMLPTDTWLMVVPKPPAQEAGYEMEFRDLFRIGRVTRWLIAMERMDSQLCSALMALYGDRGARWGQTSHGRDAAIYPLTKTGQQLIDGIRRRFPLSREIRDDELLVQDVIDQARQPDDIRKRKHTKMRNEADILKVNAHRLLEKIAA